MDEELQKPKGGINKTAVLVALILGLSVVGYGYLNISYKNKVFEAEQVEKEEIRRAEKVGEEKEGRTKETDRSMLNACLAGVSARLAASWDEVCGAEGSCSFSSLEEVKFMMDLVDKQREECFRKYPVE